MDGVATSSVKRFILYRDVDVSGVSGTGVVANGVYHTYSNAAAMQWCVPGKPQTATFYPSFDDVHELHAHDGKSQVVVLDDDVECEDFTASVLQLWDFLEDSWWTFGHAGE